MKVAVLLYGILQGQYMRNGQPHIKDFKHCWPNINRNIIQPLKELGHEVEIYVSTYKIDDEQLRKELYDIIEPTDVYYSDFMDSDAFTSKINSFTNIISKDFDFVVLTRLDLHWFKPIENIQYDKFNFLFKEKGYWNLNWTCDNLYMWPGKMTSVVFMSMKETYHAYRNLPDTHGLMNKLIQYIPEEKINIISDMEQNSHDNLYYSICKEEYKLNTFPVHPEVMERFE